MIEAATTALALLLDPTRLLMMVLGVAIGMVVGIVPGLGGTAGMSLMLPFIYGMDPTTAMALLIGMVAVIHTADTFPAVLVGVPGTAGAAADIVDGYPLAQKGEAARALGAAFFSSMIGGVFGAATVFALLPVARPAVLALGSPELFMLCLLGLSMVGVLSGNKPVVGVLMAALGLLVGSIGAAPAAPHYRYTFDVLYLFDGIPLAVFALGLFAVPELLDLLAARRSVATAVKLGSGWFRGIRDVIRHRWLVLRCSVVGVAVGIIPGLGGSVVDWVAYGVAVHTSRDKGEFGKGDIRGLIGPESSNNAKEGGALVPTLLFGVPGSGTTAVLLGGFVLLGLQPGPQMLTGNLPVTLAILWTLAIANVVGAGACLALSRWISRLTFVPAAKLFPFLLVIMAMGAYQASRHWGDLVAFLSVGLFGWIMKHLGWSRPALLIGFVLAAGAERYLWISWGRYEWSWVTRPGVILIGLLTVALAVGAARLRGVETEVVPED
ncbi:MAG: tripartite tricarboxylate transporter permease [Gemmatimonadetes bacterium]|nr:tripartite tricarboxylate transporter permease [Gemmatimonadota bacterium]